MFTFNPLTGGFSSPPDPDARLAEIEHEMEMRTLGAEPNFYPGDDDTQLSARRALAKIANDQHIYEANREADHAVDIEYLASGTLDL